MLSGHLVHLKATLTKEIQPFLDRLFQRSFILRALRRNTDQGVFILLQPIEQIKFLLLSLLQNSIKAIQYCDGYPSIAIWTLKTVSHALKT